MKNKSVLLTALHTYYKEPFNIKRLLEVLEDDSKVSLRIIDWFVTNYSKKNNIYYSIYETPKGKKTFNSTGNRVIRQFNTYHSYKSQLKSYSKKRFDPFCRRERIVFEYDKQKSVETTIGQLNFFKWAIDNLIIDYIKDNYDEIEHDMNTSYNLLKKDKTDINDALKVLNRSWFILIIIVSIAVVIYFISK